LPALKALSVLCVVILSLVFSATAPAAEMTVNKIAAVVNGEMITLHALRENTLAELTRQSIPPEDPRASAISRSVLESMINDILLRQEAARYKISVPDSEVEDELRRIMQANNMTPETFEAGLVKQGAALAELRERVRNSLLRNRMVSLMIARKVRVTKEEVAAFYHSHQKQFSGQKYADFSVIVFPPSAHAQKIYALIRSGALTFDAAARQYSIDPSGKNGGYVGRILWQDLPENVRQAFTALSGGGLTPPLTASGITALFLLKEIGEGEPQTLDQASARIEAFLRQQRLEERFKEYTQQLRGKAVVDIRL
jgi:peptidyl-prolyl cis-trans isomerase SurA